MICLVCLACYPERYVMFAIGYLAANGMSFMTTPVQSTDRSKDEALIEALVEEQTVSWNKGDAHAFSARCTEDVSFTNIAGTSHYGRAAFEQRHAEILAGIFKGSMRTQSIEKLRFLREDVAVADVKMELRGYTRLPPGIPSGSDGVQRTSLQLVLTKEQDGWRIAAFHNVTIVPSTARP
jgi:uncharacterized protein (TIGR02246 family)